MLIRQRDVRVRRNCRSSHHVRKSRRKRIVQIISSLVVPVLFGAFTIIITLYQHKLGQQDRREDLKRFEIVQQEDRNETRIQRQQDWNIARTKQNVQNAVVANRYQDEILADYTRDIGALLERSNGCLTSNRLTATLARIKTLNVLRQLDGSRRINVIRFLHEAGQLSNTGEVLPLDMTATELTYIDFVKVSWSGILEDMSLAGVYLRNCTFQGITNMYDINFTSGRFHHVNCSSTSLYQVDFSLTRFLYFHLSNSNITRVNFSSTVIIHTNFSIDFISNSNFSLSEIWNTTFLLTIFQRVNFSSGSYQNITFSFCRFDGATFSLARLNAVNFSSATLNDVDFSSIHLGDEQCIFHHALMERTNFTACNCKMADFSYANLTRSQFANANLRNVSFQNADLTRVNFSGANLWNADLTNATITNDQLQSARSIRNARLPNGTFGRARNLITNGEAMCNIWSLHPWHVSKGQIAVQALKKDRKNCQFVLRSARIGARMSQRIHLIDFWNSALWTDSSVEVHFSRSAGVSVELNGHHKNGTVLENEISNSTEKKIIMGLREGMTELEIAINFDAHSQNQSTWCDNIELFMNYDVLTRYGWEDL